MISVAFFLTLEGSQQIPTLSFMSWEGHGVGVSTSLWWRGERGGSSVRRGAEVSEAARSCPWGRAADGLGGPGRGGWGWPWTSPGTLSEVGAMGWVGRGVAQGAPGQDW